MAAERKARSAGTFRRRRLLFEAAGGVAADQKMDDRAAGTDLDFPVARMHIWTSL